MNKRFVASDESEYAFMTEPEKSVRTYDSTLSHPGSICTNCRNFVAGDLTECPVCNSAEGVIFDFVAYKALNHRSGALNGWIT